MAEAPASWNTKYISPEGFECQLTLRAESGSDLLEKVNGAIFYLLNNDCIHYTYNRGRYRGPANNKSQATKGGKGTLLSLSGDRSFTPQVHPIAPEQKKPAK
jgi:hypothetical protein